ncbi:MAG: leucine--tRNA ligase [Phycisphaerales bacterium]|nr:leucine--tRNA ligase [Phycisphaerales bacterium]
MTDQTSTSRTQPTAPTPHRYTAELAGRIEARWQDHWEQHRTFHTPNPGDKGFDSAKPKKFILDMFPYPSGAGLHVGHPLGYIATDIYARYLRMTGWNVLHTMGYDAFGLPAEQYAVQTGQHPRITTESNIATMRVQMRRLGLAHDPHRSFATTDVDYYRWTQWIFLQIFNAWYDTDRDKARPIRELIDDLESGDHSPAHAQFNPAGTPWADLPEPVRADIVDSYRLAQVAEMPVNWCPGLGTVLANEEVTAEGRSERGNFPVHKRLLRQWVMRITTYCERLLRDMDDLDWPEPIKIMQRNWIGRSEGAEVDFLALSSLDDDPSRWFAVRKKAGWTPDAPPEDMAIRVFTTRPDTLYGATYMVFAPEHPLVDRLVADAWPDGTNPRWKGSFPDRPTRDPSPRELVAAYRRYAAAKTDVERQEESNEKTGVFIGAFAVNPVNHERIPIFIADYVLMGYGTGAIMAVPAHDERDFQFATQFDLPIIPVVMPDAMWLEANVAPAVRTDDGLVDLSNLTVLESIYRYSAEHTHEHGGLYELNEAFSEHGSAINSPVIDGLRTDEAGQVMTTYLQQQGLGTGAVNYRLRDWLFSRQRYWGEPFPIVYDDTGRPIALDESDLPVELPELDDYTPRTSDDPDAPVTTPLGRAEEWTHVVIDGKTYTRELSTMPNWAGSCWYYLRYLDPDNNDRLVGRKAERYWMLTPSKSGEMPTSYDPQTCKLGGVDLYVGGVEHAVLHLLYARFWHKVLYDLGHVSTPEPFQCLFNQGYVQAHAYTDERGMYVEASEVEERDGQFFHHGKPVTQEYGKMGKSLKNVATPDDIFHEYGADTLRLYEMYMGPLEASKPWSTRDIIGVHRFLQRVWRTIVNEETGEVNITDEPASDALRRAVHKTIAGVHDDMEALGFNTAIAKMIELNNKLTALDRTPREAAEAMVTMLAPFAPHIAEELWAKLGHDSSITHEPFPVAEAALLVEDQIEIPVMVKGKVRAKLQVAPGTDAAELEEAAMSHPRICEFLEGKTVRKVVAVPDKMVNIVV